MVKTPHWREKLAVRGSAKRIGWIVFGVMLLVVCVLGFAPWQQSVTGSGEVIVFDPMLRPQTIDAQIPGVVSNWSVTEGQRVKKGQLIGLIKDVDSKFLDPQQPERLKEQQKYVEQTLTESKARVSKLEEQMNHLSFAQTQAIRSATQAIRVATARRNSANEAVKQARQALRVATEVAAVSARERVNQNEDRVNQAENTLTAAQQNEETARKRRDRVASLVEKGLRSKQDLEFAENDLVKAETEKAKAQKALEISKKDVNVGSLTVKQTSIEIDRAKAQLAQAEANLDLAEQDVLAAQANRDRLEADLSASVSRVGADIQSARESVAKNSSDVQKIAVDRGNLEQRQDQQKIIAPIDGRIVKVYKSGRGTAVKVGDPLVVIAPESEDRAVELYVNDNDLPLVRIGSPVRLHFAGWPAVQLNGFPGSSVGTFGGRVAVIDPVDDGTARYRVIVKQDRQRLVGGKMDSPWPSADRLRPGAEVAGWIMLDTVPLGFELWRQFNGFPPRQSKPVLGEKKVGTGQSDKKEKDPELGKVKFKIPKF